MGLILDITEATLSDGQATHRLTPIHCRLLEILSRAPVAHAELLQTASRAYSETPRKLLEVNIHYLRAALKRHGWPGLIRNVRGFGYALTAPIETRYPAPVVLIPPDLVPAFSRLLWSHPDHHAADPFILLLPAHVGGVLN